MGNCCHSEETTHDSSENRDFNPSIHSTEPIMNQPEPSRQKSNKNERKREAANSSKKERKLKGKSTGNSKVGHENNAFKNESEPTCSLKEDHLIKRKHLDEDNKLEQEGEPTSSLKEEPPIKRKNVEVDNKLEQEKKPKLDEESVSDKDKPFIEKLNQIWDKASSFIIEIEVFTELEDSNKYYYIEESLRRLIGKLDDMYDDLENNSFLRAKRKDVYKFIFPLFDKLDDKVKENRDRIAKNNT